MNINDNIGPMHSTPKGILCNECYIYWQESGLMRPEIYPSRSSIKKIKRPPKNLSLDLDSLIAMHSYDNTSMSNVDPNETIDPIEKLEDDIREELTIIQTHNQAIARLIDQSRDGMENMRIPFLTTSSSFRINSSNSTVRTPTWSTEEILLAIQAFGRYGKDFDSVARIVGPTKTIADVETFFLECRERYQLDMVIEINSKPTPNAQRKAATTTDLNSNRSTSNDIIFVS